MYHSAVNLGTQEDATNGPKRMLKKQRRLQRAAPPPSTPRLRLPFAELSPAP